MEHGAELVVVEETLDELPATVSLQDDATAGSSAWRSRATTSYPAARSAGRSRCPISPPAPVTSAVRGSIAEE